MHNMCYLLHNELLKKHQELGQRGDSEGKGVYHQCLADVCKIKASKQAIGDHKEPMHKYSQLHSSQAWKWSRDHLQVPARDGESGQFNLEGGRRCHTSQQGWALRTRLSKTCQSQKERRCRTPFIFCFGSSSHFNLARFGIAMETHLGVCLRWLFQETLTEEGKLIQNMDISALGFQAE